MSNFAPELSLDAAADALLENVAEVSTINAEESSAVEPVVTETKKVPKSKKKKIEVDDATEEAPVVSKENVIRFSDLGLSPEVLAAVTASGYECPTPVQAQIIPHVLVGRDVLAQSQTGSGKTAAFALPILSKIDARERGVQVLVLAPTRELAIQVANSFEKYAAELPDVRVAAIYGGQDYEIQFRALKQGVQIVVGTPGRVIDHINRGTLSLSQIRCLVLDEADEMLNMGFLEDVQLVLEHAPEERQIALFSATLPDAIRDIAEEYLREPARVTIRSKTLTAESIRQRALFVPQHLKVEVLKRILEVESTDGVIVFAKTKDSTIQIAERLCQSGLAAVALNGDMAQKVRERAIEQLKQGKLDILVATDVAARGLDVPRISHVINFDLPHDSESYIHRIGRTGRAGRSGEAVIFLTNAQRGKLRLIEKATKQPIQVEQPPTAKDINAARVQKFKQQVLAVAQEQELGDLEALVRELCEENGLDATRVAAALGYIARAGRPLVADELELESKRDRFSKPGHFEDNAEPRGDRRPSRRFEQGSVAQGMQRYRLDVGRRDGVQPRNIVGAVANEGNISSREIGPIKIYQSYTTIDLPDDLSRESLQALRNAWVAGRPLSIRPYDMSMDDRQEGRPARNWKKDNRREAPYKGNARPRKFRAAK